MDSSPFYLKEIDDKVATQTTLAALLAANGVQRYVGATLIATVGAEAVLDCRALGGADYPKSVTLHARASDMYIAQGPSTVALHATAAQNFILEAGSYIELQILSAATAYFAHEQVSAAGVIAVTRTDLPSS